MLLAVDDDREVVRAVERDLRNRYARDFTVVAAGSGDEALEHMRQPRPSRASRWRSSSPTSGCRDDGVELLAHVAAVAPDAKRVLLTAYADTEAAMRAINEIRLDHYLMKPGIRRRSGSIPCSTTCSRTGARTPPRLTALADGDGEP